MAFLLVYLERSSKGIHPASSVALCSARDIASTRGATLLAICEGEGGQHDQLVADEASRRGADQLVFTDRTGFKELYERLAPKSLLGPATAWSVEAMAEASSESPQQRWLTTPEDTPTDFPPVVALFAGALPWHDLSGNLEPEYAAPRETLNSDDHSDDRDAVVIPNIDTNPTPAVAYVDPEHLADERTRAELALLGATEVSELGELEPASVVLCFGRALPEGIDATAGHRWCLLPGVTETREYTGWQNAHWVLPGPHYDTVRQLHSRAWRDLLT